MVRAFPHPRESDFAAYLVRDPCTMKCEREATQEESAIQWAERERLNVPVRPGDRFTRFAECAVVDFLRFLCVRVELRSLRYSFGTRASVVLVDRTRTTYTV